MESSNRRNGDGKSKLKVAGADAEFSTGAENVKIIQWEDFEHALVRFCSLKSGLMEAEERKRVLNEKLEAYVQVRLNLALYYILLC